MLKIDGLKKFFFGKKVLITGHTGFKGSYMCVLLKYLGARVYGYSLKPEKNSLYELINAGYKKIGKEKNIKSSNYKIVEDEVFSDIRDEKKLYSFVKKVNADYIIHMAAQPLVLKSYDEPRYTYEVNVMGTVNLLEAIRKQYTKSKKIVSIINVTTDKVYQNLDFKNYSFKEDDKLCGLDPYANSKSCSDIITYSYNKSFYNNKNIFRISTVRSGNVIGGGDFNENRIIPDCFRSIKYKKEMIVRNGDSIRPYQYVLEPLIFYLNVLAMQRKDKKYEGSFNIGPDKNDCLTTKKLTDMFFSSYSKILKKEDKFLNIKIRYLKNNNKINKHESRFLRLDNSLIKKIYKYKKMFNIDKMIYFTAKIYKDILENKNIYENILEIIEKSF